MQSTVESSDKIECGSFNKTFWNTGHPFENGNGDREFNTLVPFKSAFKSPPHVALAISGIDSSGDSNHRILVYPKEVTNEGFIIELKTWGDSTIFMITVNWFAIPMN